MMISLPLPCCPRWSFSAEGWVFGGGAVEERNTAQMVRCQLRELGAENSFRRERKRAKNTLPTYCSTISRICPFFLAPSVLILLAFHKKLNRSAIVLKFWTPCAGA
jgi:hypothetical protein